MRLGNQALCRWAVVQEASGLDREGREEGHMHREVGNWQISLRKSKNLGGFKTGYGGK